MPSWNVNGAGLGGLRDEVAQRVDGIVYSEKGSKASGQETIGLDLAP